MKVYNNSGSGYSEEAREFLQCVDPYISKIMCLGETIGFDSEQIFAMTSYAMHNAVLDKALFGEK